MTKDEATARAYLETQPYGNVSHSTAVQWIVPVLQFLLLYVIRNERTKGQ